MDIENILNNKNIKAHINDLSIKEYDLKILFHVLYKKKIYCMLWCHKSRFIHSLKITNNYRYNCIHIILYKTMYVFIKKQTKTSPAVCDINKSKTIN